MEISVVICTRNRAESLRRTLHRFSEITIPEGCSWEIIAVDNGSTDSTRTVIEEFRIASGLNVIYIYEPKPGLSHARNRGIREATGEMIAFTDDDIIVDTFWIQGIYREGCSNENAAMCFGQTKPYSPETPHLSTHEKDTRQRYSFPCSPWAVGHGNNMIMRSSLVGSVGAFDTWLGAGSRVGAAEDTDYVYRVLRSKREILFSPSIVVYHDHDRISQDDVRRIEQNYAKGRGAFYCKHIIRGDIYAAKLLYWEVRWVVKRFLEVRDGRRKAVVNLTKLLQGFGIRILMELHAFFIKR
jgi:glycosyltransferase involved in cell wall biosynthesis